MDDSKHVQGESGPHSYIIKIWPEQIDENGRWVMWRGHITHVPSGIQQYFDNLNDVTAFIKPFLSAMGITLDVYSRLEYWAKRKLFNWSG